MVITLVTWIVQSYFVQKREQVHIFKIETNSECFFLCTKLAEFWSPEPEHLVSFPLDYGSKIRYVPTQI